MISIRILKWCKGFYLTSSIRACANLTFPDKLKMLTVKAWFRLKPQLCWQVTLPEAPQTLTSSIHWPCQNIYHTETLTVLVDAGIMSQTIIIKKIILKIYPHSFPPLQFFSGYLFFFFFLHCTFKSVIL